MKIIHQHKTYKNARRVKLVEGLEDEWQIEPVYFTNQSVCFSVDRVDIFIRANSDVVVRYNVAKGGFSPADGYSVTLPFRLTDQSVRGAILALLSGELSDEYRVVKP